MAVEKVKLIDFLVRMHILIIWPGFVVRSAIKSFGVYSVFIFMEQFSSSSIGQEMAGMVFEAL